MKAFSKLTLVAAAVGLFAATTQAGDIVASPKVLALQKSLAKVGSAGGDKIDRAIHTVPPRTLELHQSLAKVGSAGGDKINRTANSGSLRARQAFELAPLK